MVMSLGAWRHAGARFLLSGDAWPVVWPRLAAVSTPPFGRARVAAEAIPSETTTADFSMCSVVYAPWQGGCSGMPG